VVETPGYQAIGKRQTFGQVGEPALRMLEWSKNLLSLYPSLHLNFLPITAKTFGRFIQLGDQIKIGER